MASAAAYPQTMIKQAAEVDELRASRLSFIALCLFILSQMYTLPILPVGPSWAIWPGLPDLAIGLLIFAAVFTPSRITEPSRVLTIMLMFVLGGYALSFFAVNIWFRALNLNDIEATTPLAYGGFQVFRMAQFIFCFWAVTRIPMSPQRIVILKHIVTATLLIVCVGVLLVFFSIVQTSAFGGHLPNNKDIAGPWAATYLRNFEVQGLGTIGYNHSYVAAHIILLVGFRIHLSTKREMLLNSALLLLSIFAVFATESRIGFVSILILAVLIWIRKPIQAVILSAILISLIVLFVPQDILSDRILSTVDRQRTVLEFNQDNNLSNRDRIWRRHFNFLNEDILRWMFGIGVGTTQARGVNAHMLPLQIIMDTGIPGLLVYIIVTISGLYALIKYEPGTKAFLFTSIALLVSSTTQETFYPVPAFGYFMGLYLVGMAVVLQRANENQNHENTTVPQHEVTRSGRAADNENQNRENTPSPQPI